MAVMLIDCGGVEAADTELRYLTGALTEDEAEAFEAHFMGCERCWTALHRAIELSAALPDATAETSTRGLRPVWRWGAAGAAATLCIVLGTTWGVRAVRHRPVHSGPTAGLVARASPPPPPVPPPPLPTRNPAPAPHRGAPGPAPAVVSIRPQSLGGRGDSEVAGRRPDLSIAALDSARRLADSEGLARERVKVRIALARADGLRGESATAVRWAGGAVRIADSLGDPDAEIEARKAYGAALAATGDLRADDQYRRAIALLMRAGRVAEARDLAQHAGLPLGRDQ
jgi:hypothetical protein